MFDVIKELNEELSRTGMDKILIKITIAAIVLVCILGGCQALNDKFGLEDDNLIEEMIENKIEEHTGLDIDLSPATKEKL